jgi:hypothetical protein
VVATGGGAGSGVEQAGGKDDEADAAEHQRDTHDDRERADAEAKNEALSAVDSAVSLIHTWRAALLCGRPVFGSLTASAATSVPLPSAVANCGIWA